MKLLGVVFVAVALLVVWLICGSGPGGGPVAIESPSSGSRADSSRSAGGRDAPANEVLAPTPAPPEPPVPEPVTDSDGEKTPPPAVKQPDAKFEFLKSLEPGTRSLVENAGCGAKINGLLKAMSYTPNPESLNRIAAVVVQVEQNHAARLAALDRERIWNLSDPQQIAERRRRELELAAGYREEQYESLQGVIPSQVLDTALEKMGHSDPDDER